MSASSTKPASGNGPVWLDQVLGCLSPAFSFRDGGSAITGNAVDRKPAQQNAAIPQNEGTAKPKGKQRG